MYDHASDDYGATWEQQALSGDFELQVGLFMFVALLCLSLSLS